MNQNRGHGLKRGNACFQDDPAGNFGTQETFIHEARRKRIRVGTAPSSTPIADMWRTSAQTNASGQGLQLDFVNYANHIQTALSSMFGEIYNAVNKVQEVIFKISSSTGRAVKHARRVYIIDTSEVEMREV